jgi:hypothetical protein
MSPQCTQAFSRPEATVMLSDTFPTLFAASPGIPPYLALWRRAFDGLPPARSVPVTLWFDRGAYPPLVETVRLPARPHPRDRRLAGLFAAAVVNNILCSHGAASVSLVSPDREAARGLRDDLERLLFYGLPPLSCMSPQFLFHVVRQVFGVGFSLDNDPGHAAALRAAAATAKAPPPPAAARPARAGLTLSVNIGQHLTGLALVRLEADGGFAVEGLTRRDTWPSGARQNLSDVWQALAAEARSLLAAVGGAVDAVGVSIAATVTDGVIRPVPQCGLFEQASPQDMAAADASAAAFAKSVSPGRPMAVVNDAEAQAVFAFHHGGSDGRAAASRGSLLSVRLGACPAVRRLDAAGQAAPGIHEYGWLITRYAPKCGAGGLFSTIHPYLSHHGVAVVANELGLLAKYRLSAEAAIPFLHGALGADDPGRRQEARRVYGILGVHLALLVEALARLEPLSTVQLLGSRANRLDATAFAALAAGYTAFDAAHGLGLATAGLELVEDASAVAGLVGAAHAALDRVHAVPA